MSLTGLVLVAERLASATVPYWYVWYLRYVPTVSLVNYRKTDSRNEWQFCIINKTCNPNCDGRGWNQWTSQPNCSVCLELLTHPPYPFLQELWMPISTGLDKACKASAMLTSAAPMLPAALEELGYAEIIDVLCSKTTFMEGGVSEANLIAFNAELRGTTTGGAYPADNATVPPTGHACTRLLIHTARRLMLVEKAADAVPAGLKVDEDLFKPLPEAEILDVWNAVAVITDGYAQTDDDQHLSDNLMSQMVREGKDGRMYIPAIDQDFKYKMQRVNRDVTSLMRGMGSADIWHSRWSRTRLNGTCPCSPDPTMSTWLPTDPLHCWRHTARPLGRYVSRSRLGSET